MPHGKTYSLQALDYQTKYKKNMQENFLLNFKLFRITVETFDGKMILHE